MFESIMCNVRQLAFGSAMVLSLVGVAPQAAAAAPLGAAGLDVLRDSLAAAAPVGTVTYVDPATDAVVLRVPGRLSASLGRVIGPRSAQVRVEQVPTGQGVAHMDGDALYGGIPVSTVWGLRQCTAGFTVRSNLNGAPYVVTAGHCLKGGTGDTEFWYRDGPGNLAGLIGSGTRIAPSFPGNDYGVIGAVPLVLFTAQPGVLVNGSPLHLDKVRDPAAGRGGSPGSGVCKSGRTTGPTCGNVLATNVSVTYAEGVVSGLAESNMCAQAGDSGAPVYSSEKLPYVEGGTIVFHLVAYGVISGGNGATCGDPNRRTYFQPLSEILSAYQMTLLT